MVLLYPWSTIALRDQLCEYLVQVPMNREMCITLIDFEVWFLESCLT